MVAWMGPEGPAATLATLEEPKADQTGLEGPVAARRSQEDLPPQGQTWNNLWMHVHDRKHLWLHGRNRKESWPHGQSWKDPLRPDKP